METIQASGFSKCRSTTMGAFGTFQWYVDETLNHQAEESPFSLFFQSRLLHFYDLSLVFAFNILSLFSCAGSWLWHTGSFDLSARQVGSSSCGMLTLFAACGASSWLDHWGLLSGTLSLSHLTTREVYHFGVLKLLTLPCLLWTKSWPALAESLCQQWHPAEFLWPGFVSHCDYFESYLLFFHELHPFFTYSSVLRFYWDIFN